MRIFLFLVLATILNSCIEIIGYTNDYQKLTDDQKNIIVPYAQAASFEKGKIYTINGKELLNELEKHPKSLVYIFANRCSSELCFPMAVYEEYAKIHGQKLFLVMSGFGNLNATTNQPLESPLYAIDGDSYQVKRSSKYYRKFSNDIRNLPLNTPWKEYEIFGNLYFYSGNHLDTICRELPANKVITPYY